MILESNRSYKSLDLIPPLELPDLVIISGVNGSGKTHLIEGIAGRIIELRDGDSLMTSIKLVDQSSLSPNSAGMYNFDYIRSMSSQPFQFYKNIRSSLEHVPSTSLEKAISQQNPTLLGTIRKIATAAGKSIDGLTEQDFIYNYPYEAEIGDNFFQHNFTTLFKRYQIKKYQNEFNQFRRSKGYDVECMSDEEFDKLLGEPPWVLVNQIMIEANLGYIVKTPEADPPEASFQAALVNQVTGKEVDFHELSSGEKVIMSLTLAVYNSQFDMVLPEVMVLDEPDAHLHPSMTKQFLEVVRNVFVASKGIKVIMTTHSPSTVALAPEETLFVMNKVSPRISKGTKDQALRALTEGVPTLSINYENRRQVFVESKYDALFYEKMYEKLKDRLEPEISINFIASGPGGSGSSDQVKELVTTLERYGNRFVFGIIDWDTRNTGGRFLQVLGSGRRYSIENYILDPILLAAFLLREKVIDRAALSLDREDRYADFDKFDNAKLQVVADYVVNQVRAKEGNPLDTDKLVCRYVGGRSVELPTWFLTLRGHKYEEQVKELFPPLRKYTREGDLKREIISKVMDDLPELIPADILEVLSNIQSV